MERRCRMVPAADLSPIDPLVQDDPYPWYAELRRGPAATYLPHDDLWVVSRFEHVRQVVRQPESFSSKALHALAVGALSARTCPRPNIRELDTRMSRSLIASDPPDHTRLRRLVRAAFHASLDQYAAAIRSVRSVRRSSTTSSRRGRVARRIWSPRSRTHCRSGSSPPRSAFPANDRTTSNGGRTHSSVAWTVSR